MAITNTNKYVALRMRLVSTCRIFPKNTLPTNNPPFRARQILKPGVCVYNLNKNFRAEVVPSQLAAGNILFQEKCIRVFKTLKEIDFF